MTKNPEKTGFQVELTFVNDLGDFLPRALRKEPVRIENLTRRSIKDLIESLGIPHTELGVVELNGEPADMSCVIDHGCRIKVHPPTGKGHGAHQKLGFVVDVHLGSLARRLRLLGIDTLFDRNWVDDDLASISSEGNRILLTRDRRLLMRKTVRRGGFIRSTVVDQQVDEVLNRFDLKERCRPFTRCLLCNGHLRPLTQKTEWVEMGEKQIPPKVRRWCRDFTICENCHKVYWKGSHFEKLKEMVDYHLN